MQYRVRLWNAKHTTRAMQRCETPIVDRIVNDEEHALLMAGLPAPHAQQEGETQHCVRHATYDELITINTIGVCTPI